MYCILLNIMKNDFFLFVNSNNTCKFEIERIVETKINNFLFFININDTI